MGNTHRRGNAVLLHQEESSTGASDWMGRGATLKGVSAHPIIEIQKEQAMNEYSLSQRLTAEFLGTLWLVLGGCGSAVLAAAFP